MTSISVIIPTFNRARMITYALKSIIHQTEFVNEVIIIDDGSTDNTFEVIKDFKKKHEFFFKTKINYYKFLKNGGIPRALNQGYRLSSGTHICQLSSDDWWEDNKIKEQLSIMEDDPRVGLVYSNYNFVDLDNNNKTWKTDCFYSENKKDMFKKLFESCFMNACTFLMRKEFYKDIGEYSLRPEFEWNQDLHFNFRACLQDKWRIGFINNPLASITIHSNQASKQGKCGIGNNILFPEMVKLGKQKGLI